METIDYIIIAAIALIVAVIAVYIICKRLKGEKIGCGCGCQSCPHAGACGGGKTTEENHENNENCSEKNTEESGEKKNDETL